MRKKIKPIGTSQGIIITKEECKLYNLKIGDLIEFKFKKLGKK